MGRARQRVTPWVLGVCLAFCLASQAQAQSDVVNREYPLKALFLYNFGSYIDWPAGAVSNSDPFVIGILGPSAVDAPLREIAATQKIHGRPIVVKDFSSLAEVHGCQILFIPAAVGPAMERQAIDRLRGKAVLVVGESSGFAARGGAINFFIEANKIRFEVNVAAAAAQQLKISAKLLALAKIVETGDGERRTSGRLP